MKVLTKYFGREEYVIEESWLTNPHTIPRKFLKIELTNEVIIAIARWKVRREKQTGLFLTLLWNRHAIAKHAQMILEKVDKEYKRNNERLY